MGALHTYNTSPLRCGSVGLSLVKTWDLRLKGNEKEIRFEMKPDFSRVFSPLFSRSILFIRNCIFLEREREREIVCARRVAKVAGWFVCIPAH